MAWLQLRHKQWGAAPNRKARPVSIPADNCVSPVIFEIHDCLLTLNPQCNENSQVALVKTRCLPRGAGGAMTNTENDTTVFDPDAFVHGVPQNTRCKFAALLRLHLDDANHFPGALELRWATRQPGDNDIENGNEDHRQDGAGNHAAKQSGSDRVLGFRACA